MEIMENKYMEMWNLLNDKEIFHDRFYRANEINKMVSELLSDIFSPFRHKENYKFSGYSFDGVIDLGYGVNTLYEIKTNVLYSDILNNYFDVINDIRTYRKNYFLIIANGVAESDKGIMTKLLQIAKDSNVYLNIITYDDLIKLHRVIYKKEFIETQTINKVTKRRFLISLLRNCKYYDDYDYEKYYNVAMETYEQYSLKSYARVSSQIWMGKPIIDDYPDILEKDYLEDIFYMENVIQKLLSNQSRIKNEIINSTEFLHSLETILDQIQNIKKAIRKNE